MADDFKKRDSDESNDRSRYNQRPHSSSGDRYSHESKSRSNASDSRENRKRFENTDSRRGKKRFDKSDSSRKRGRSDDREFRGNRDRSNSKNFSRSHTQERSNRPDWLKRLILLQTDRGRKKENRFLAEGKRCVEEILRGTPEVVRQVHLVEGFSDPELEQKLRAKNIRLRSLEKRDFDQIAGTVNAQGILAECDCSALRPHWESAKLVTLVDAIQDPGNMGALFRTALAFGSDALVLGKGSVDPFNAKVVRGSTGTFLRMPFETDVDLAEKIAFLRSQGFTILGTSSHATHTLDQIKVRRKVALLMGNEGAGAQNRLLDLVDEKIKIAMAEDVESLNVSVAHGILMSQIKALRPN